MNEFFCRSRRLAPGIAVAALAAMAAQFLSDHYGAPAMLMAILIGLAFHFLSDDPRTAEGLAFASRTILRLGVALLGLRISFETVASLGPAPLLVVVGGVAATILFGLGLARLLRQSTAFGFLTGGSVAICGASAAMAIAAILPPLPDRERNLSFTVISVTLLSTLAMVLYPILASWLGLDPATSGLLLGATIHDVAQAAGAGFSVSAETGEIATLFKLIRVALLGPVIIIAALLLRRKKSAQDGKVPILPGFVIGFTGLAIANSFGAIPLSVVETIKPLTSAALLMAIAAVGIKTSIPAVMEVGPNAMIIVLIETLFLLGLVLACMIVLL
jgi:uncharacterized integral membrane protein (TIGR00698 family)